MIHEHRSADGGDTGSGAGAHPAPGRVTRTAKLGASAGSDGAGHGASTAAPPAGTDSATQAAVADDPFGLHVTASPLLAHEAAHVVQQRHGTPHVQRKVDGGGDARDERERAADVSADRFRFEAEQTGHAVTAKEYVRAHLMTHIGPAVTQVLVGRMFAPPHPRVRWGERGATFADVVLARMHDLFAFDDYLGLPTVLAPTDLWTLVDRNRLITDTGSETLLARFAPNIKSEPRGPMRWVPDVAVAIASRFEERIRASLPRVLDRYVQVDDELRRNAAAGSMRRSPVASEIIPGHPMDRLVIRAVCEDGMIAVEEPRDGEAPPVEGQRSPRRVSITWLSEPGMWNWVRVEPADATREEVAYHLFKDYSRAHELTASPPFFALPVEEAVRFPEARIHRARHAGGGMSEMLDAANRSADLELADAKRHQDPAFDPVAQLAKSRVADEAARAQASRLDGGTRPAADGHDAQPAPATNDKDAFAPVVLQLQALQRLLAPWGGDAELAPVLARTEARATQLAGASDALAAQLVTLARTQHAILLQIGGAVAQLAAQLRPRPEQSGEPPHRGRDAGGPLAAFVRAAAHSDLPETARAELARALDQQRLAATDALELMLADAVGRVEALAMDLGGVLFEHGRSARVHGLSLTTRQRQLRQAVADLRSRLVAGEPVAGTEIQRVHEQVASLRFEAELLGNMQGLEQIFDAINELEKDTWTSVEDLEHAKEGGVMLRAALGRAHQDWLAIIADRKAMGEPTPEQLEDLTERVTRIQTRAREVAGSEQVAAYLRAAHEAIEDEAKRAMIRQIGVFIGVTIVASAAGGFVAGAANAARGLHATATFGRVLGMATESLVIAGATAATQQDSFWAALASDFAGNVLTFGTLWALEDGLKATRLAQLLASDGLTAGKIGAHALHAGMTGATLIGTQTLHMNIDAAVRGREGLSLDEMFENSAKTLGMAVGHGVTQRLLKRPMQDIEAAGAASGAALRGRYQALAERANRLRLTGGSPDESRAVLTEERALYEIEIAALQQRQAANPTASTHQAMADARGQLAEVNAELGSHLVAQTQLEPVIPGHSYAGTPDQVDGVLRHYESAGFAATVHAGAGGRRIDLVSPDGGTRLELLDRRPRAQVGNAVPAHARTTAPMDVVDPDAGFDAVPVAVHDQPTGRMHGAPTHEPPPPFDDHRPARTTIADRVSASSTASFSSMPPLQRQIDEVTAVSKGPAYDEAMEQLRAFYADMENEAANVSHVRGRTVDGPYAWDYAHESRRFSHGAVHVIFRVHLEPTSLSIIDDDLARLRVAVAQGVDAHYNFRKATQAADGTSERLHLEVEFVDDPAQAHLRVLVHPDDGDANLHEWYLDGDPTTHAHEVTHGAFGIKDEYADPKRKPPGREHATDVRVARDGSVMGDYWAWMGGERVVAPGTGLRQRHLDAIWQQMPPRFRAFWQNATSSTGSTGGPVQSPPAPARDPGAFAARPEAATATSPESFAEQGRRHLERLDALRGVDGGDAARETEELALDSEWQFEAGIRVADPLFGKSASVAFRSAVAKHEPTDAAAAAEVRRLERHARGIQKRMLETLRDPSVDTASRKRALHAQVDELEAALRANDAMAEHGGAFRFDAARAAIEATIDASFDRKLVLDQSGKVRRGRKEVGTFRELMDRVIATNRAMLNANDPRELVISVSDTPGGAREVLLLARRRTTAEPSQQRGEPLEIQTHPDASAVVVDVGAGESSFALDLLAQPDRTGGPVVQTEYGPTAFDASRTRRDLTWENAVPRTDADSVVVFGDPLQTMDLLFGQGGVKRVFINNVNAHYGDVQYRELAQVLLRAMAPGGRVEVQWTDEPEYKDDPPGSRGHVDGPKLKAALADIGQDRPFSVTEIAPETDYAYSIEPSRRRGGVDPSKAQPSAPVPEKRWVFTFQ